MSAHCPFSSLPPIDVDGGYENIQYRFDSPRTGGLYRTRQDFYGLSEEIESLGGDGKARLITLLVDQRKWGEIEPEINFLLIERARSKANLSHLERSVRLLQFFVEMSGREFGRRLLLEKPDSMFTNWISSRIESPFFGDPHSTANEINSFCKYLEGEGFITFR